MSPLPLLLSLSQTEDPIRVLSTELHLTSSEQERAATLLASGLPPLANTKTLSLLLGISQGLIIAMKGNPQRYYRVYTIPKRSGGNRRIEAPRRFLKLVQRWIYDHILTKGSLLSCVNGFVPHKGIFDNALPHTAGKNLMVVDIQDFFPSIEKRPIMNVFHGLGFSYGVSEHLASLCTIDERLPQGAPTSPALANLVFKVVDEELSKMAVTWGCIYTRYADDLAFSGDRRFSKVDLNAVGEVLHRHGYKVNRKKSRIVGAGSRQIVTGLVVNEKALPPRWKRRQWRATFDQASKHPTRYKEKSSILRGIAAFVNQYDAELAIDYFRIADRLAKRRRS